MPRHTARLCRAARICLLLIGAALTTTAAGASGHRTAQRHQFKQAYAVARKGGNWRHLAVGLQHYALYPYLEAAALGHDLRTDTTAQVRAYIDRYPQWIPAQRLRAQFLGELARRKDWSDFLALYRPGLGSRLHCDALQARLAQGGTLHWKKDMAKLWTHPSLPNSCNPVQEWAQQHGLLTPARLWARIDRAATAGRAGTIASLARWLPSAESAQAQRLVLALRKPAKAASAAASWPDTVRTRQAATLALLRLARHDNDRAQSAWARLRHHFKFSLTQRHHIEADVALYDATDFGPDALKKLAQLPAAAQTATTREWRVRVALAQRDWPAVLHAIRAMPAAQRDDNEWQYFRARALAALGHSSQAHAQFEELAQKTNYYGFLAADRVHEPYTICPASLSLKRSAEQKLLQQPDLQRAFELFAVGLLPQARREWDRFMHGRSTDQRHMAADLAYRQGWYDRPIFTFSSGDALHLYRFRFPLARRDGITAKAQRAGIDPAWAYGIIRAESAWMTDAHSGADARGLMQLLPGTAARVARRNDVAYTGDLYDPRVNVSLGTYYLGSLADRYNGAPWLASAAYNAGPGRVDQWLDERGQLPPDLFVATIPFHETRDYVASVMAFSVLYDWRLHSRVLPMDQRMPRFGQPYTPPDADTPRKGVVCPAQPRETRQASASMPTTESSQ